jgi:hypothetical protein
MRRQQVVDPLVTLNRDPVRGLINLHVTRTRNCLRKRAAERRPGNSISSSPARTRALRDYVE